MTRDKDRKRIIRDRMNKTGESYTAARVQILSKARPIKRPAPAPTLDYAKLAGMSDDKVAQATGRAWREWTQVLDGENASTMRHRDIALLVHEKYGVREWWTQTVTVGYERIKGLRDRGQRRGGAYETTKSKTFNVPVNALFRAWADDKTRRRWIRCEHLRPDSHSAKVDSPAVARRDDRRRPLHGEGADEERRGDHPDEAAQQGSRGRSEESVDRSARCVGVRCSDVVAARESRLSSSDEAVALSAASSRGLHRKPSHRSCYLPPIADAPHTLAMGANPQRVPIARAQTVGGRLRPQRRAAIQRHPRETHPSRRMPAWRCNEPSSRRYRQSPATSSPFLQSIRRL